RIVQDGRADAHQHLVFENAAVHRRVVANRHQLAHNDRVEVAHSVEHGAVLHVALCADADGVHVAAHDGVHPDAGLLAEHDIADDLRGGIDVTRGRYDGFYSSVRPDHEADFTLSTLL